MRLSRVPVAIASRSIHKASSWAVVTRSKPSSTNALRIHPRPPSTPAHLRLAATVTTAPAIVTHTAAVAPEIPRNESLSEEIERCYARLDLSFKDTKEAFKSKSNWDLLRAFVVLRLCTFNSLVVHNQKILDLLKKVVGKQMFDKVLKSSFYGQFVAGESQIEVEPVAERLSRYGVNSILFYSVESDVGDASSTVASVVDSPNGVIKHYEDEKACDRNVDIFCESIDASAAVGKEGFAAIKFTALGRPQLLLKMSDNIVQTHGFLKSVTGLHQNDLVTSHLDQEAFLKLIKERGVMETAAAEKFIQALEFDREGFVDLKGWKTLLDDQRQTKDIFQTLNLETGHLESLVNNMSEEEEYRFLNMKKRIVAVARHARERGVRLMIDAEQTYFQPAIERLAVGLMRKFNTDRVHVLNTYQAYLKGTFSNMDTSMDLARREGWHFGVKLVRGAYMDQERQLAAEQGYEDPVNENYDATSANYKRCLTRIADEYAKRGNTGVNAMVASHNESSVRFAVNLMKERGIAPSQRVFRFAQLYGMCDHVTFSVGQAGYPVYKCVPYGPVDEVLPYLSRRALENKSVLSRSLTERRLLKTEMARRLVAGEFRHAPAPTPVPI